METLTKFSHPYLKELCKTMDWRKVATLLRVKRENMETYKSKQITRLNVLIELEAPKIIIDGQKRAIGLLDDFFKRRLSGEIVGKGDLE